MHGSCFKETWVHIWVIQRSWWGKVSCFRDREPSQGCIGESYHRFFFKFWRQVQFCALILPLPNIFQCKISCPWSLEFFFFGGGVGSSIVLSSEDILWRINLESSLHVPSSLNRSSLVVPTNTGSCELQKLVHRDVQSLQLPTATTCKRLIYTAEKPRTDPRTTSIGNRSIVSTTLIRNQACSLFAKTTQYLVLHAKLRTPNCGFSKLLRPENFCPLTGIAWGWKWPPFYFRIQVSMALELFHCEMTSMSNLTDPISLTQSHW
jgi:hypothetical protein